MAEMALANSLIRAHLARGGNAVDLFSAFVGVVCERDKVVGHDCLTALDQMITGASASERTHWRAA
jgi:hypothetical protein